VEDLVRRERERERHLEKLESERKGGQMELEQARHKVDSLIQTLVSTGEEATLQHEKDTEAAEKRFKNLLGKSGRGSDCFCRRLKVPRKKPL